METILDKEYFHFGTKDIRKELWLNLYMQRKYTNYSKPLGGLWCSKQNEYTLSEWLMYIEDLSETREGYNYDDYVHGKDSSLVKFKPTSKLLEIKNSNDFKNLEDSGYMKTLKEPISIYNRIDYMYIYKIPDYEKIKTIYDLLYINSYADKSLYQYSVDTLLAINPNSIEYFKPLICDYTNKKIISIGDKQNIKEMNSSYLVLLKYIKELVKKEFNDDLYVMRNKLFKLLLNDKNITNLIPNNIDKSHALGVAITNSYNELQDEKKLILHN